MDNSSEIDETSNKQLKRLACATLPLWEECVGKKQRDASIVSMSFQILQFSIAHAEGFSHISACEVEFISSSCSRYMFNIGIPIAIALPA